MAAPQIPNLNTLRAPRGRGRLRDRDQRSFASQSLSSPEEEQARKDDIIRQTDLDATHSRLSAVKMGYLKDPFVEFFVSTEIQKRFPVINRGTYVRTKAIDDLVDLFLSDVSTNRKQIISLGAGSDTRYWRIMNKGCPEGVNHGPNLQTNLIYHEYDLPENVSKKISIINSTPILSQIVGPPVHSKNEGGLDCSTYHLHPIDLRTLDKEKPVPEALREIDITISTIIISECCLCYIDAEVGNTTVKYFNQFLFPATTPVGIIIYEPIHPDDGFGRVMAANLANRGIVLMTLWAYATLDLQARRVNDYGFEEAAGTDINGLWDAGVTAEEKRRIAALEWVDEVEEWEMLSAHYCVVWAWRGEGEWAGWKQLKERLEQE